MTKISKIILIFTLLFQLVLVFVACIEHNKQGVYVPVSASARIIDIDSVRVHDEGCLTLFVGGKDYYVRSKKVFLTHKGKDFCWYPE